MKPLVSVLIPVYNAEKYLRQCLDSVISQTHHNLEIICINNASTDSSLSILQEYAKSDARITIINKPKNKGYADSINIGISSATGEYISIVESDDWAAPDMIQALVDKAVKYPQADIVRGDYYSYISSGNIDKPVHNLPAHLIERLIQPSKCPDILKADFAIWSAIYKKEFLEKNHIHLNDKPNHSFQDVAFTIITWALAEYVYLIEKPILHYRRDNIDSSVHQKTHVFAVREEFTYAQRFLGNKAEGFQAVINHLKLSSYWWNIKRVQKEAACEFIIKCSPEIRQMILHEKIDWNGLALKTRFRSYIWAFYPKLLIVWWKLRK